MRLIPKGFLRGEVDFLISGSYQLLKLDEFLEPSFAPTRKQQLSTLFQTFPGLNELQGYHL